jgi:deoxyadenosine/deoxycytidine kinase
MDERVILSEHAPHAAESSASKVVPAVQQQLQPHLTDLSAAVARFTALRNMFSRPNELQTRYAMIMNSVIAAEGIICAGKSAFLRLVKEYLITECQLHSHVVFETPCDSLLALFYRDMKKYALTLQLDMLRQRQHTNEISLALAGRKDSYGNSSGKPCIVWNDRSLWGDAVFAMLNFQMGNMTKEEFSVYTDVISSKGPYLYDYIVFFDVEAERAHYLCQNHRKNKSETGIPLEYFQKQRRAYYFQLRDQALLGQARIVYIYNDPWVLPRQALDRLVYAPTVDQVCQMFQRAPKLDDDASEAEVSAAFAGVRKQYDAYFAAVL